MGGSPRALTAREWHVATRASQGLSNKVIASERGISTSAVAMALARARVKLGVASRTALIVLLRGAGVATAPEPRLTPAERAVVAGLLAGLTLSAIAMARRRSAATIKHQAESVYRKLGVQSRSELAARFARR